MEDSPFSYQISSLKILDKPRYSVVVFLKHRVAGVPQGKVIWANIFTNPDEALVEAVNVMQDLRKEFSKEKICQTS